MKYTIIFIVILTALAFVFFGCEESGEACDAYYSQRWPDRECCLQAAVARSDLSVIVYQQCIHNKLLREAIDKQVILPEAQRF